MTVYKFYNPSEDLAIDEVTVMFKGRVIFRQYIPKKHKHFGVKIYKLCNSTGYRRKSTWGRTDNAQHST